MTAKTNEKKKRISITIDTDLFVRASADCQRTGKKLSTWIQVLLEKELRNNA